MIDREVKVGDVLNTSRPNHWKGAGSYRVTIRVTSVGATFATGYTALRQIKRIALGDVNATIVEPDSKIYIEKHPEESA